MNTLTKALQLLLVAGLFFTVYIMSSTHEAPELWPSDNPAQSMQVQRERAQHPVNVPTWKASDKSFGCTRMQTQEFHKTVLAVTQSNERVVMTFDKAWTLTNDDTRANDVWIVGFCS